MFKRFNIPFDKVGEDAFHLKTPIKSVPKGATLHVESYNDFINDKEKGRLFKGYVIDEDNKKNPVEIRSINIDWVEYNNGVKK